MTTERVTVDLADRSYTVLIGERLLDTLGETLRESASGHQVLLIMDSAVESPWGKHVYKTLAAAGYDVGVFEVPTGETSKSPEMLFAIWEQLAAASFPRDSMIVALGGGMVGDLAGFAAATYHRGISYVHVPTTLLGMVDSSVGGKTAVNLAQGKNLVGAFWQPVLVVADLQTLGTLPEQERSSGVAEIIKYGVIRDAPFFELLERRVADLFAPGESALLSRVIRRSVEIKAEVVAADERESNVRAILNFGHTLGHAIEAEQNYRGLRHGEAIAVGMLAASLIAVNRNSPAWTAREHKRLEGVIAAARLPLRVPAGLGAAALAARTAGDKKVRGGKLHYVLPVRMGEVELVRDVEHAEMIAALRQLGAGD